MPELRKDPMSGRWVIISVERGKRPSDFGIRVSPKKGGFCAFCKGNEHTTPPEIMAFRENGTSPNTPGWTLRVVSNKFPALNIEGDLDRVGEGMFDKMNGVGAHEVIIECPDHNMTLSTMPLESVENVLRAFYNRIGDLKKDSRIKYVLVFKNEGDDAGASLEHTHSQLIALPIIPHLVDEEIALAKQYHSYKERCIFCDIIRQESEDKKRIISENDDFIAMAPFAPRSPFETMILPKKHESSFLPKSNINLLAGILQKTLKQLTKIAGFEWGSGFYINPTPPEEAAKFMREADI
jgi:UDPglucose--hexose-1-phosphate uridylyltransferase